MKIRFILRNVYGPGGGVLRVVLNLVEDLKHRHDVGLVSVLRNHDEAVHTLPEGVPVETLVDLRPDSSPEDAVDQARTRALRQRSRLIVRHEPAYGAFSLYSDQQLEQYIASVHDGVLVGMQPGMTAAIAQLASTTVVRVGQEHRPYSSRGKELRKELVQHYGNLDVLLTLTERDARSYRRIYGDRLQVGVLPNGTVPFTGVPADNSTKVVVAAGRLGRSKGFDRLLTAWRKVAAQHRDWELRIFGGGELRDELENQIAESGIGASAHLMGYSTELANELAAASIFVLSSRAEGYPMVLLEAMSCGLPVVSFDCPTGPREIISPEKDGFLVPNGDVDGLADAIIRMIELGDGRRNLGAAALEKARRNSQPVITAKWEELFREQLAAKDRGA